MIQVSKYNSIERVIEGHNFIKRGRRWLARHNFARMNGKFGYICVKLNHIRI